MNLNRIDSVLFKMLGFKKYNWISPLLGVLFIGVFLYLINCFVPIFPGDDMRYSFVLMEDGQPGNELITGFEDIIESQYNHYMTWSGRFVAHTLLQFFLWIGKGWFNFLNSIIVLLVPYFVIKIASSKLNYALKRFDYFFVYLFVLLFFINFHPMLGECIFWMTGAFNYSWTLIIQLSFISLYIHYFSIPDKNYNKVFVFFFGIITGATNENAVVGCIVITFLIILIKLLQKEKIKNWALFGAVGLLIGFALLICAPGNFVRSALMADRVSDEVHLTYFIERLVRYMGLYFLPVYVWFAFFLALLFKKRIELNKSILILSSALILGGLASFAVMFFVKGYFPPRTLVFTFICFMLSLTIITLNIKENQTLWFKLATLILLVFFVTKANGYYSGYKNLYEQNRKRENYILTAKESGKSKLQIDPFEIPTGKFFVCRDIGGEFYYKVNVWLSKYYKMDSVRVKQKELKIGVNDIRECIRDKEGLVNCGINNINYKVYKKNDHIFFYIIVESKKDTDVRLSIIDNDITGFIPTNFQKYFTKEIRKSNVVKLDSITYKFFQINKKLADEVKGYVMFYNKKIFSNSSEIYFDDK